MKDALLAKIQNGSAVVAVVGLGYVGLPLARHFIGAGHHVIGVDTALDRVAMLLRGECPLCHLPGEWIAPSVASGHFSPTTDTGLLAKADAIIICVPTPLTAHREPDLSHVRAAAEAAARTLHPGQLIVLESTTWPGTTEEVLLPWRRSGI